MMDDTKQEYVVKTCAGDDTQGLEDLLNEMAEDGWQLYSLSEAESDEGFQYNCIFSRPASDLFGEKDEVAEVGHFKSRMRKLLNYKNDPYEEAKGLQKDIKEHNERIEKIKQLLDSNSVEIDREKLNEEISEKLEDLSILKNKFAEILTPANMYERIHQEIIAITVSEELSDLIDNEKNGELIIESIKLRQELADKLGYVIPHIRFISSDEVGENQYVISIRKLKALSGLAYPGYRQFKHGQANLNRKPRNAIESLDPVTGQKVFWLEEKKTKDFWDKGLNPSQVIISQLDFILKKYVDEILSYSEILNYISFLGDENLFLAEELLQKEISIGDLRYIFASLIREKVSIKDIVFVFEKLNDLAESDFDKDQIVDNLRILLSRQICSDVADSNNFICGIVLSNEEKAKFKKALDKKSKNKYFVQNTDIKEFINTVQEKIKNTETCQNIALIVVPELRRACFHLFEQIIPDLRVLSEDETAEEFTVEFI